MVLQWFHVIFTKSLFIQTMKTKFTVKSTRVKGTSFHPSRPWILVSLHTGVVQIWDYKIGTQVAKFDEHEGPVRTANFHHALPLFVTGGDDSAVKVWNYKQRKCLFTLKGHIDYIRTAVFHRELPWILTACDDQTMRIWNYQSRNCINILTGHTHYVMCAQFHHEKNLIVSCSLDATVRLWDFSVLRKRLTESHDLTSFVGIEIECIKVLEGHERGVNWVAFHPSMNFIASASDDRKIKLWKYTSEVAWEHSTITGHNHNVSCVMFDTAGRLFSNSQDKTIRIWNIESKQAVDTFKTKDRHWILGLNKTENLLVTGHDQGFQIVSINNEKVPYTLLNEATLIVAEHMELIMIDFEKGVETKELYQYVPKNKEATMEIKKLFANTFENSLYMALVKEDNANVFVVKKKETHLTYPTVVSKFQAKDACFVSDTHLAILQNESQIEFVSLTLKDAKKKCLKLNLNIKRIFSFEPGVVLLATENLIAKFQYEAGKMIDQFDFEEVLEIKQIVKGNEFIALLFKHKIIVIDEEFTKVCEIKEQFPINSAFWERDNLLFYTTTNHWKYSLMNGETGILKSIQEPLHLIKKTGSHEYLAFSQLKRVFRISCPKYNQLQFKLALYEKEWDEVKRHIKQMPRRGKNIVGYLVGKDHSSIALDLVTDKKQRFALSINSSQFQLAYDICNQQNNPEMWGILSEQALKQGVYNVVEVTYQKLQKYQNMSMMYVLQGNEDKLSKMLKLSQKLKQPTSIFNNSIWLNDPKERTQLLNDFGYSKLSELSSIAYKLSSSTPEADGLLKSLGSAPLTYCKPVTKDFSNWPHNEIQDQYLLSKQG